MTISPLPGPARDEVQAHRGASAIAPENTIAAFRAAAEQGAKWVELDVALSADGELIVIHDDSVDRTSSGTGNLGTLTAAEIAILDGGAWFAPRFAGERIPTLSEVITALGEIGLNINVEIKQHPHHQSLDQLVSAVHAAIIRRPAHMQIMISSFDPECLKAMHRLAPELELAMLWDRVPDNWEALLAETSATSIHAHFKGLSIGLLEQTSARGIKVRAWTSNDPLELVSFWRAGLTGVITDNPQIYLG
ncbi:MAG: glycerophosphoryl diester phosphodiesterase [Devosia sp.]|uniref:glycerophosphoryl diester phosphodiesterase n=1 Tax=unclassified Devosia TaxID=196773 RepID=UPI0019E719A4|nr:MULTISPECIES: glycerophosphoryl diester phosphodiesterase [unclassified Devosia]MBF0678703.1 glycerophosphoryl diester phosphodiesterase [Devosia sp.]WEJ31729.1 glycerophosphoryl diester phosphodiesterase [Devosia sp. SD17-2]